MEKKNMTLLYTLMMAMYWMGFAIVLGFVSVYLIKCGFNSGEIGIVIAVSGTLSALLQPVIASYADRSQRIGIRQIIAIIGALMVISGFGLLGSRGNRLGTLLCYGLNICLLQVLTPLLNAMGIGYVNAGGQLNIGFSRGGSSVAYAAAAFGLGTLVDYLGSWVIPAGMCLCFGLMLLGLWWFPSVRSIQSSATGESSGVLQFFRKYPSFTGALCGCSLLFISHVLLNSFTYQIVVAKGGDSSEMGFSMALAAVIEILPMVCFGYLLTRAEARSWFRLSGIFFTLKSLGSLLCSSIIVFYAVQLFQMGGWAIISVSSIFYINQIMEPGDSVKGQAYYTMTYTIGSVLGAIIGGQLIDSFGVQTMLAFATASAALGTGIVLKFTGKGR